MKRIGLISDTHGKLADDVISHLRTCDEIWHAGDIGSIEVFDVLQQIKPTVAVYGNIDGGEVRNACNAIEFFEREDLKILIHHYGGRSGKFDQRAVELIKKLNPDLFVCGHSHILHVGREPRFNNCLILNPGAAGYHGFHSVRTLLRFTLHQGKVTDMEAIELKKRRPDTIEM